MAKKIKSVAKSKAKRQGKRLKDKDMDSAWFRRLVARRSRQLIDWKTGTVATEKKRRKLEKDIKDYYEKIHKEDNFLPARFLKDGAVRADAVCRIVIRPRSDVVGGYGTGFLIARGFIMTNNHVLRTLEESKWSIAEFGYENNGSVIRVPLAPQRLFLTSRDLDYTIIACDDSEIQHIAPIPLLRDPSTVTRHERVNIVQHPRARPKEIAIHDNPVIRIKQKVIHYHTDTEPGSSGSPVFNNNWDLVALHHAGWSTGGGSSTNEGVRISAIVSHLLRRNIETSRDYEAASLILDTVQDISPYLGFFDWHGVTRPGAPEIEVPDFHGTNNFADVGVWNIEHFNDSISDSRVNDVADVVARLSLDVLGLVEVQDGAMQRLVEELGSRGNGMGYELHNVRGRQDLAILYDQDTSTVRNREDITRRHYTRLTQRTASGKTAFPRLPMFAECTVSDGNDPEVRFLFIVVHFKAFGDTQSRARRRLASEILAEIIEDIRSREGLPVVLGGDFNERLDNDVLTALHSSPDLFAMTADDATTDAISYVGSSHRSLIDHVMVSRDVRLGDIQGDDAAIVRLDRSVRDFSAHISDHVPVVFRMVFRDTPLNVSGVTVPRVPIIGIPAGSNTMEIHFR